MAYPNLELNGNARPETDDPLITLRSLSLIELFDDDPRPILVFDLLNRTKTTPLYHNSSLCRLQIEGASIEFTLNEPGSSKFKGWAITNPPDRQALTAQHFGIHWTSQTLRNRWRIISGQVQSQDLGHQKTICHFKQNKGTEINNAPITLKPTNNSSQNELRHSMSPSSQSQEGPIGDLSRAKLGDNASAREHKSLLSLSKCGQIDITASVRPNGLSSHINFFLDFDWASTALGPISSWSTDLRHMVNFLMADPRPSAMYWSPSLVIMYNEAYVSVTGQKHPRIMGQTFAEAWSEVAEAFIPEFDKVYETGTAFMASESSLYINRHGYLEETYYSIAIVPINTRNDEIAFYNPVFDVTRHTLTDRRMKYLLRLGRHISSVRTSQEFWCELLKVLESRHPDLPAAILYTASPTTTSTTGSAQETWALKGMVGILEPANIPAQLATDEAMNSLIPNLQTLIKSDSPKLLLVSNGSLPLSLSQNLRSTIENSSCESAIILSIQTASAEAIGLLIIGLNPRKRYDHDYSLFMDLLGRQLNTSMATAILFEDEIKHSKLEAERRTEKLTMDRDYLSEKLAIQTYEALEIETRFRRMADLAPVGMFQIDKNGLLLYGNESYYNLTEHARESHEPMSWYGDISELDHPLMNEKWDELLAGKPVSFEMRLKRPFLMVDEHSGKTVAEVFWIIVAAYPARGQDGSVEGILGCLTDISRQKFAESLQIKKKIEAEDLKRKAETFIDMTSHEMRNPLSAIIQCTDWIISSVSEYVSDEGSNINIPREVVEGITDAAQTVFLCAMHQKRIIDDILTLSKLDSDLLLITPVETQPLEIVEKAVKMFEGQVQKSGIELHLQIKQSYLNLGVDWVQVDPSRILQVLINLITNSIKFTQTKNERKITVSIGASLDMPISGDGLEYLPRSDLHGDLSKSASFGVGEMLYLQIQVQDTGKGLDEHEKKNLFKRFHQASARTHVQYGGSGLGLFISRELTELQGGQIGVASIAGVGSTFAFYVKTRRCLAPKAILDPLLFSSMPVKSLSIPVLSQSSAKSPSITPIHTARPALSAPKHVLIVEDNLVNQKVLSKQLLCAGFIVSVANHGLEALSFIETTRSWKGNEASDVDLSVILMDLEMPIMDGLTCVREIRALQAAGTVVRHIPVIAVTANARSLQIASAKEAGMDSVVTKPFRIPELIPVIDGLLETIEV